MWKNRVAVTTGAALATIALLAPAAQAASAADGSNGVEAVVTKGGATLVKDDGALKCWKRRYEWTGEVSSSKLRWWMTAVWCAQNGKLANPPTSDMPKDAVQFEGGYVYNVGAKGKNGWVAAPKFYTYRTASSDTQARFAVRYEWAWGGSFGMAERCGQFTMDAAGKVTANKKCGVPGSEKRYVNTPHRA